MLENKTKPLLFKRFLAGLIDYTIVFCFFYFFVYLFGKPNSEGEYSVTGLPALIPIIFWFVWIVLIETFFGATIGNSIVGIIPKSLISNNGELTFSQSLKRHFVDLIDMFPFGLLGIMCIRNTEKNQRIGDIWAKTIVIENNKIKLK